MVNCTAGLVAYTEQYKQVCAVLPYDSISRMVDMLWQTCLQGKAIFTMGNGGHCNTASHMINDLAKHTVSSDDKAQGRCRKEALPHNVPERFHVVRYRHQQRHGLRACVC